MLHEDVDDCFRVVDVVVGVEFKFLEFGILADEILDGVFESFHDFGELGFSRWCLDVNDDFVIDSQFLGDRQGIGGRASMIEVVDGDFGHAGNLEERVIGATAISLECESGRESPEEKGSNPH